MPGEEPRTVLGNRLTAEELTSFILRMNGTIPRLRAAKPRDLTRSWISGRLFGNPVPLLAQVWGQYAGAAEALAKAQAKAGVVRAPDEILDRMDDTLRATESYERAEAKQISAVKAVNDSNWRIGKLVNGLRVKGSLRGVEKKQAKLEKAASAEAGVVGSYKRENEEAMLRSPEWRPFEQAVDRTLAAAREALDHVAEMPPWSDWKRQVRQNFAKNRTEEDLHLTEFRMTMLGVGNVALEQRSDPRIALAAQSRTRRLEELKQELYPT